MDTYMVVLVLLGLAFLGAAWVPHLFDEHPLSFPALYVALGFLLFELPLGIYLPNPLEDGFFTQRFTEMLVLISLAGAGLKLARPLGWRTWASTWRLLALAMPLLIALGAVCGWGLLGLAPASALLLAAVLAPTDPVLASDVQVGAPDEEDTEPAMGPEAGSEPEADGASVAQGDVEAEGGPKEGDVRFALTSEAGLNDALAFPFVYAAMAMAASGGGWEWLGGWALDDLLLKLTMGTVVGVVVGLGMARLLFRLPASAKISATRDGFVVVAITLFTYGAAELLHGYGFLAVFLAALTVRQSERTHRFHVALHDFAEGLERLLMSAMLILFGGLLSGGLLAGLGWREVAFALLLVFGLRPLTAWLALLGLPLPRRERLTIAAFGIRGVGSLYYLSYALNNQAFDDVGALWRAVAFAILASIAVHGSSASLVMRHLDRHAQRRTAPSARQAR